jgi:hypothetical protein
LINFICSSNAFAFQAKFRMKCCGKKKNRNLSTLTLPTQKQFFFKKNLVLFSLFFSNFDTPHWSFGKLVLFYRRRQLGQGLLIEMPNCIVLYYKRRSKEKVGSRKSKVCVVQKDNLLKENDVDDSSYNCITIFCECRAEKVYS